MATKRVGSGHEVPLKSLQEVDSDDDDNINEKVPLKRTNARIYPTRKILPLARRYVIQRQTIDPKTKKPSLSAQARIQVQAQDVLNQLEALPPGPFGPVHQQIIARNLALIQGVTADTAEEKKEAERKRMGIEESVRSGLRMTNPRFEGGDGNENDGGRRRGGGKRKRGFPNFNDPDAEAKAQAAKRVRVDTQGQRQIPEPVDFVKLAPLPTRIKYPMHPSTDRPDSWFIHNFEQLYIQTEAICSHYYEIHDIPIISEPWLECKMTPEFIRWAEQVVEPNPRMGSWDELLREKESRKWFVMAVLVKIFKVKIFDKLLFGAHNAEWLLLHQVDKALLGREGFQREEIRSKAISTILGHSSVPSLFYAHVATLTAQIALMLSPLTTYLYSLPPPPSHSTSSNPLPKITSLYQSLHNLVSQAAYLSICVKLTPSIIQIHDIRPGDQWQPDDMDSLDTDGFVDSKSMITEDFKQEVHNLGAFTERKRVEMQNLMPPLEEGKQTAKCKEAVAVYLKYNAILAEKKSAPPTYTHRALVKISVWPVIRRYSPGDEEEYTDMSIPLREKDGFRIMLLKKGRVVSYYGRDVKDLAEYSTLMEWITMKKRQREELVGLLGWKENIGKGAVNLVKYFGGACAVGAVGTAVLVADVATGGLGNKGVGALAGSAGSLVGVVCEGVRGLGFDGLRTAVEGGWENVQSLMELGAYIHWR